MSTVISELVVSLGLDPKKFTQGQKEALDAARRLEEGAEKSGKNVEAHSKRMEEFFGRVKSQAIAFTAAFLGGRGAKEFTEYITNLDASTGRLSKTLNTSVQEVSAWQGVARRTGGSVETISNAMQGLTDKVSHFVLTGQGDFLPVFNALGISLYDANKNLKTSSQLLLDINKAVQGMDPARARSFMQSIGLDSATINMLLMSEKALKSMLDDQRRLNVISPENVKNAQDYQKAMSELSQSTESLGRSMLTFVAPGITAVANSLTKLFQSWNRDKNAPETKLDEAKGRQSSNKLFGDPKDFMRMIGKIIGQDPAELEQQLDKFYGPGTAAERDAKAVADAKSKVPAAAPLTSNVFPSPGEREAYIRESAKKRGIDPDQAVRVARSEGLGGRYAGDDNSSFGDFQLHYGGVSSRPGMGGKGLGDEFTKQTGLDARDNTSWKQQIDFSLDKAKQGGWGPWHGWKGLPFQGISPGGATSVAPPVNQSSSVDQSKSSTSTVTIGTMTVHAPNAKNGEEVGKDIMEGLRKESSISGINYGLA